MKRWTWTSLEYREENALIKLEIDDISPHQVDEIVGDGHCFVRAISKAITGTQTYHADFRKAVVEWMLCEDHPQRLAQYIVPFDAVSGSDCQSAIQQYIDERCMSLDGWGSDKEIRAFATMLQIVICVSTNSPGGRRWNYYSPIFFRSAEENQTTTCTCITQTVSHIMTSLFPQNHENANTRVIKLS